jgi:hypothetical protein
MSNLPTKDQLREAAHSLSTRTPEWAVADRQPKHPETKMPAGPSVENDWVIAASQDEGWHLKRFQQLLEANSIPSEIDRLARVLRVRRDALRAACHLQRVHRQELRRPAQLDAKRARDAEILGLAAPPILVLGVMCVLLAVLVWDKTPPLLVWPLLFASICLTALFMVRIVAVVLEWLRQRHLAANSVSPSRGHPCDPHAQ